MRRNLTAEVLAVAVGAAVGLAVGLVVAVVVLALAGPRLEPGLIDGWYHVQRVVDGDTIIISNVGRLRFADMDAPEPDEPGGLEAKAALVAAIEGKAVFVSFSRRKKDRMPARDRYGRLLAKISSERLMADIRNP